MLETESGTREHLAGSDTGRLATQRVPPKVRSDGEVELTASLLAQRLLLLAVLVALLPALPLMFFEFRFLIVILHFLTSLRPLQLALGADGAVCNWVRFF